MLDPNLPDKWFWVGPSSVVAGETKSRGLYSLYPIKKGTILPGCYSGSQIRTDDYSRLIDEIEAWAKIVNDEYKDKNSKRRQEKEKIIIEYLSKKYDLTITGDLEKRFPDWLKISKGLTDYSYEGEDIPLLEDESSSDGLYTSKTMLTILPVYDFDGQYVYDPDGSILQNFFCFANEPPTCETFVNKLTNKPQQSKVNISAVLPSQLPEKMQDPFNSFLRFKACADIEAGDELFLCYGASYARSYDMNMNSENGCGCYSEVSGYLTVDVERETYETIVETFGIVPKSILAENAKSDKRIMQYFDKIHPPQKDSPPKKRRMQ